MICNLAQLDGNALGQVKAAEKETGKTLLAYSCFDSMPETLSENELDAIRELERKLGILLVAVKQG